MITYAAIGQNKRKSVLLIFIFLLIIITLGYVFSQAYGQPEILIFAVIFSTTSSLISYYFSDSITLSLSSAHQVNEQTQPKLYKAVENLAITAGLPLPRVYIIEDSAINAFATGRDPKHAIICVTTGCIERLTQTELEGVIAHELSHVGNYDIRFMTLVVVMVGTMTLLADWFLRFSFLGKKRDNQASSAFAIIGIILAVLSPVIAMLIQLSVSRQREFLADASGSLLTRYPEGLASALEKIAQDQEPLEAANKATAHLFIANPLKNHEGKDNTGWFAKMFNTHPPLEERIKRLREMNL